MRKAASRGERSAATRRSACERDRQIEPVSRRCCVRGEDTNSLRPFPRPRPGGSRMARVGPQSFTLFCRLPCIQRRAQRLREWNLSTAPSTPLPRPLGLTFNGHNPVALRTSTPLANKAHEPPQLLKCSWMVAGAVWVVTGKFHAHRGSGCTHVHRRVRSGPMQHSTAIS